MSLVAKIILGIVVSFYLFPISFIFLPNVNTKTIFAIFGLIVFYMDHPNIRLININLNLVTSTIIAALFSIVCLISADINDTQDYSYATYISSFFVWLSGGYFVSACFRGYYGEFTFRALTYYLLGVCASQCIIALLMDNFPLIKNIVNSYVLQGQEFYEEIGRLYGIGAALDSAGVRFAVTLIMTACLLSEDEYVRKRGWSLTLLLFSFFIVALVGNMISRTTIVGVSLGLLYFVLFSGLFRTYILFESIKLGVIFAFVLVIVISVATFLYTTNEEFYSNMRFAFEGFFNWVETGEWRTSSTDKLNNEMWIWPSDAKSWIIGTGLFGSFVYSTDIGYCRFILYSGLAGFSIFALLFVFNAFAFMQRAPKYWIMFLIFGGLSFVIWIKVATDIFFIYALLYSVDRFVESEKEPSTIASDENSLLYN